jgi:hypothetical protein
MEAIILNGILNQWYFESLSTVSRTATWMSAALDQLATGV